MKKKLLAGLLSALMLVTSVNVPVFAEDGVYDTFGSAGRIGANETVTGALTTETDVDNYKFTFEEDGILTVNFRNTEPDAIKDWGWDISVYDEDGVMICEEKNVKTKYTFGQMPFKKGTSLYIKVKNNYEYILFYTKSVKYQLTAGFRTDANWEAESNNTMGSAQNIVGNNEYHGDMLTINDKDYYKLVMPENGVVSLEIKPVSPDELKDWGWDMIIYDENGNELKTQKNIRTKYSTGKMALAKGTVLYILVDNNYEWPGFAATFVEYILRANVTPTKGVWETEFNNQRTKANTISLGKKYYGTMLKYDDQDFYKISVTAAGTLAISIKSSVDNDIDDVHYGWDAVLYDSKGNEITNGSMKQVKTKDTFSANVSKGTYYLLVKNNYEHEDFAPIDCVYELTTDFLTKAADKDITVPTINNKTATVKWKKVNNISGYELRWSTKSNMSGATKQKVASNKTSYTINNLKAKTTYYVQIRAYKKTASGKTVYGSWSATKKIVTKK